MRTRFGNVSWITGDQIYLLCVTPSREVINDPAAYEFYAGQDREGRPVWTGDLAASKPLVECNNNMVCHDDLRCAPPEIPKVHH